MASDIATLLTRKWATLALVAGVFVGGTLLVQHLGTLDEEHRRTAKKEQALRLAGDVRARIEYEINTTLNLTQGLLIYVNSNPDITQEQFARIGQRILQQAPFIANIGLARDNVISHMYPLAGNERALGLRYLENPTQRDAVSRAIASRHTVIAGPVELVQGGAGLISRIPIFLDDAANSYWGIASLVVRLDAFLQQVGLHSDGLPLRVALRGKDARGDQGEVFFGDAALFDAPDSQRLTISLPEGSWTMAAAPRIGTDQDTHHTRMALLLGQSLTLLVSVLLFALLNSNAALRRAKLEVEASQEHKSRFFTNMTHELRTPLTAIHGAIRIVNSGTLAADAEKSRDLLQNAERNCKRLMWIVNDMLDLKKLESGKMEYHRQRLSIAPIVRDAIDELREYASQHEIVIEPRNDGSVVDVEVDIDAMRCHQVIVNLLSNAVKHSPIGAKVEVGVAATSSRLRVEVMDRGTGIPTDKLGQMFTEFGQAVAASSHVVPSTGLGLSISRHIIHDHGGSIGCNNRPGGGAVFWFELPLAKRSGNNE